MPYHIVTCWFTTPTLSDSRRQSAPTCPHRVRLSENGHLSLPCMGSSTVDISRRQVGAAGRVGG